MHGLLTLTLHALYKGVALSRCGYFVIDSSGQARAQYLGGSVASAALAAAPLPVSDALLKLFGPQGDLPIAWWRGRDDATPVLSLPEAWQRFVTSNGFLLARVTTSDAQGLIYADGRRAVSESQFANFQVLCSLLQSRLGESLAES